MQNKKTFGEFITRKRKENHMTQQAFAEKLFVTESAVSKWERGVSYPDITLIHSICEALHITEHELLTASEDIQTRKIERLANKYQNLGKGFRYALIALYALGIITCFICNLAIFHTLSWFFIVLTAELVAASLTLVPVLMIKHRCMWTLGAFTISLGLLLMTCCLYTGGNWFFVAYFPVLFGLCVIFLPFVLRAVFLPAPLSHHKTLICFTVDSLLLFLLLFICNLYTQGGWFWNIAVPSALFCLILPFGMMAIIRYAKMNAYFKTAACFGLAAVFDYTFIGVLDFILEQKPYRFGFQFNFSDWSLPYLSDNINMIIFLSFVFLALLFAVTGMMLSLHRSKQQTLLHR